MKTRVPTRKKTLVQVISLAGFFCGMENSFIYVFMYTLHMMDDIYKIYVL